MLATRHEYAVGQALGATSASIARRYFADVLASLGAGSVLGAAGGTALNRLLRHWRADAGTVDAPFYVASIAAD